MAEAHFWCTIWFMISEKNITGYKVFRGKHVHQNSKLDTQNCALILSSLKLLLYGLVVFIDTNNYIPTEARNFNAFLKENHDDIA